MTASPLDEWVVIELSAQGEEEDPDTILQAIRRLLKREVEIFLPVSIRTSGDSRVVHKLIDNYVFVRRTLPDTAYLRLEGTRYIDSVLTSNKSTGTSRKITGVRNSDIEKMRRQIHVECEQGINVGDEVQITGGAYRNIVGKVIEDIPETESVQVHIQLRSKEAIVTLPRSFLRFVAKGQQQASSDFAPFANKLTRIRDWIEGLRPLAIVPGKVSPLLECYVRWRRLTQWWTSHQSLKFDPNQLLRGTNLLETQILSKLEVLRQQVALTRSRPFFELVAISKGLERADNVRSKLSATLGKVRQLQRLHQRLAAINSEVRWLEASLLGKGRHMVQNVVVDGLNLAYRVYYAYAASRGYMAPATEGTVLAQTFLKSLASLRKKFDRANIYVVWDGSSQYRRGLFSDYKKGRSSPPWKESEMQSLREVLSGLKVQQVCNPTEEADDVIACLVRGPLKGQANVIVSTDRDFLQLVTHSDLLLVPKQGARAELLYDRDKVVSEFGLAPERLNQYKAFCGDKSDNLPGVPRVPKKVFVDLINTFHDVESIFASSLSNLTVKQCAQMRGSEAQVKLNLHLVTLRSDLTFEYFPELTPDETEGVLTRHGVSTTLASSVRRKSGFEKFGTSNP